MLALQTKLQAHKLFGAMLSVIISTSSNDQSIPYCAQNILRVLVMDLILVFSSQGMGHIG